MKKAKKKKTDDKLGAISYLENPIKPNETL